MPSESDQQNFLARRVYNRRPRYYNLTLPQWGALGAALTIGAALWWLAAVVAFFSGPDIGRFALRLLGPGTVAGALGVLFYALADDMREPVLRQSLYFVTSHLVQRHAYQKETPDAHPPRRAGRGRSGAAAALRGGDAGLRRVGGAAGGCAHTVWATTARAALSMQELVRRLPRRRPRA